VISAVSHVHSDWSYDGKWPLSALVKEFERRGCRVLLMTEHDRGFTEARRQEHRAACEAVSSRHLLVIPGIEYSDGSNTVHVLVWGPVPFLGEGVSTGNLLKAVKAANGLAVLAHPARRRAWKAFDPGWTRDLVGMEVWNRKSDGWAPNRIAPLLMEGTNLVPFVGVDFHDRNQIFPLAMELDTGSVVSEESVLESIRLRRCRATAFGRPIQDVKGGLTGAALKVAERCRRSAAAGYRLWRRAAGLPKPGRLKVK
jgi:hypothetical protein